MQENDIDVKYDTNCDPTKAFALRFTVNTTFKQIYLESTKFIMNNNMNGKKSLEQKNAHSYLLNRINIFRRHNWYQYLDKQ